MSTPALEDLFRGLVFYGTGGGGRAEPGLALLRHFGADWTPRFTAPADLPPDAMACATIVIGGRDPAEDMPAEERARLGVPALDLAMPLRFARAVQALERATGTEIAALAVVELGSLAMAATLVAADMLGKAVLDADGTGRSIPELGLAKLDLVGLSPAPAALVDRFGNETVLLATSGAAMTDHLARRMNAAVHGRGLACAGYLAPMRAFAAGLVPGSVAAAHEVGALLGGPGPAAPRLEALFARTGGRRLFSGTATEVHWRSAEPYRFRDLDYHFAGTGPDQGETFRIWVKNEHHLVWRGAERIASSPDPIAVLDARTLEPLTTLGDVEPGREVVAVVVPALDPIWRTAEGIERLSPARLGFETGEG
ncbi:DUF917 domain-containing protein [Ancylobacter lacus]|uniref:DUF917 domain-containing protein n=1 Tax=Ancylobacter lacus TaxID=2579970 RepID=UPI001BCEAD1E|nr:DUF917 domain-containing protein [Ancylobacter lacus]MBS7540326.1 DUF917 domain-containing protein [Ancylobacter lacus]